MKALLVFIGFVLVADSYQQEPLSLPNLKFWTQLLAPHVDDCLLESGVDRELAERMIRYKEFPNDTSLGCYIKCIAGPTRLNTMSNQGELLVGNIMKLIGAPSDSDIIDHCKELHDPDQDLCESALSYCRCGFEVLTKWKESQL